MCDEFTLADDVAALSRRQFATLGAAAVAAGLAETAVGAKEGKAIKEETVLVPTADGQADCFFVRPAKGKHPAVILWPDVGGLRDAFKTMARRLAGDGFAVLAVNHYYRAGKAPLLASFAEFRTPEGRAKLGPAISGVNAGTTARDTQAFIAWLDKNPAVNARRKIGNQGYCQTGSWTIRAAAASGGRIGACASFHGGGLVNANADSPHKVLAATNARYLIAIAKNDDARAPGDKDVLKATALHNKRAAEVEVYGGDHGWTVPDSPAYNKAEGDRAHARLLAMYSKL